MKIGPPVDILGVKSDFLIAHFTPNIFFSTKIPVLLLSSHINRLNKYSANHAFEE